jgi:RND family efflux transporter MFP subunit
VLVGEARPYANVTLYSKISGYIQEIRVDKGDKVQADQVIAIIDSPELNKLHAAAVADAKNKRVDAERARYLLSTGSMSAQNAEAMETSAKVAEENSLALKAQKDYEVIRAPFAGTVTARYADPGALVQSADTSQTTALPVVTLSQTDRLRAYIYPDQKIASSVRVGDLVEVSDATRPEVKLSAAVSRTSGELDPKTRTLLVEIDLDNSRGEILANSFVQVKLSIRVPATVEIPAGALAIRDNKPHVAVVSKDDKVNFRSVSVLQSDGKRIRVLSGVREGERVVISPGEGLVEGEKVQPSHESEK